mgnify:CR=1 FL=1
MNDIKKMIKQIFCNHTYYQFMTNYYPSSGTERVYICPKCGKEVRIKDNE